LLGFRALRHVKVITEVGGKVALMWMRGRMRVRFGVEKLEVSFGS
jgi:hypothetical protein